MFYINREQELTVELLHKMINAFRMNVEPQLKRYKNYYDGIQAILNKSYVDESKPCNKTVVNYCKNIADSYTGYIASPGCISYNSDNDIEVVMDILRYNDYQQADSNYLADMVKYGVAAELMYMDNQSKTRFKLINPTTCFGVYDDSLTEDLLYFVRLYKANVWDETDIYNVDVYSDYSIKHYTMSGANGYLHFVEEKPHYFSQCPANIAYMPDEKAVFECIISEQDTYNALLSAEVDDYSAFCDAYLMIMGADLDSEDVAMMKQNRVLILPEGANAAWLTKSANDTQVENILKRLHEAIYRTAACPDFSSESFVGGVSSGIAIQYRLTGMETRAGIIEAEMKKALQRRIEIICGMASLKLGEEVFRDIEITFKRNIPVDETSKINLINTLKGTVSDETLLAQLDFITDVQGELEKVAAQKEQNMSLYSFGNFVDNDNSEDENEI